MSSVILFALVAALAGVVAGYFIQEARAKQKLETAAGRAAKIIEEAEAAAKERTLEAKREAVDILEEAKKK